VAAAAALPSALGRESADSSSRSSPLEVVVVLLVLPLVLL
jgi:hypothetical protein